MDFLNFPMLNATVTLAVPPENVVQVKYHLLKNGLSFKMSNLHRYCMLRENKTLRFCLHWSHCHIWLWLAILMTDLWEFTENSHVLKMCDWLRRPLVVIQWLIFLITIFLIAIDSPNTEHHTIKLIHWYLKCTVSVLNIATQCDCVSVPSLLEEEEAMLSESRKNTYALLASKSASALRHGIYLRLDEVHHVMLEAWPVLAVL